MCSGVPPLYAHTQFNADSGTTTTGPDGDGSAWLPAGSIFYPHSHSRDLKIGVGILGFFGLGLEYEDDWVGRCYVQEVTLQALHQLQPELEILNGLNMFRIRII